MTRVRDRFRLKCIGSRGFSHFGWKNSLGAATADGKRLKLLIKTRKSPDPLEKLSASVSFKHSAMDSDLSYFRNGNHSIDNWFDQ